MMSLPLAFNTARETIPAVIPYLRANPALAAGMAAAARDNDGRARWPGVGRRFASRTG